MILLKLKDIKGDCKIPGYDSDWITCSSLSFSVEREPSESGKGGTADMNLGQVDLPPVEIGKSMDTATVYLFQQAMSGKSLGTAEIDFVEAIGEKTECYLKYKLDNAVVLSWDMTGDEDDRPTENVKLFYNKISMFYRGFDGKSWTPHGPKGWNRVTNQFWND